MAAPLQLDEETGRYVLDGRELHGGDVLELALEDGAWVAARFEWQQVPGGRPKGYFLVALAGDVDAMLFAPEGARARWPKSA